MGVTAVLGKRRPRAGVFVLALVLVGACNKRSEAPPASWQPDRSCTTSAECRPVEGCCPSPCTSEVINVRDMDKMRARRAEECKHQKPDECPQAGACMDHAYLCVRGQCALVFAGSPDWPSDASAPPAASASSDASASFGSDDAGPADAAVLATSAQASASDQPLDTSCGKDPDCVPYQDPCACPKPCTHTVINRRELDRLRRPSGTPCAPKQCPSAGACRAHEYLCVRGRCAIVFEGDKDYRPRKG